ncbi:MAG: elongation factor P [bacterium]|nr:elongation factor P [bacterium]MDD3805445.1 elongation factor P [bacterium]MDD4153324.1 elongation factor P [bacterium]MDD4559080.1 elongation factor P [bacterium]
MISTAEFKNGLTIELDGEAYAIIEFQHVKPGKGGAFVRTKLRNAKTGNVLEKTFRAGEKMPRAIIERKRMQFLYESDNQYYFMDVNTYEQDHLTADQLGSSVKYLKEEMMVDILIFDGKLIGVELPSAVELRVAETDPGLRGDTASGGSKPATLETGAVIQVPLFIEVGDILRVDTRTDSYVERVAQ